jgi:hypothetical protein
MKRYSLEDEDLAEVQLASSSNSQVQNTPIQAKH